MVLEDHIKKGKKLLPKPLSWNIELQTTSWQIERMPQFILLALYLEDKSLDNAIDTFLQMSVSYDAILKELRGDKIVRPIVMREHLKLEEYEKLDIKRRSEGAKWRRNIEPYLNILSSLFISNPMDYLLNVKNKARDSKHDDNIKMLKNLFVKTTNRRSKSSLFIQCTAVTVEIQSGHTILCNGVKCPDLKAIVDYPNTEESENAAGFVVVESGHIATGLDPMNPGQLDMTWQRLFWDSCYRLGPCEFNYER